MRCAVRVLVLGHRGRLGRRLLTALLEHGHEPIVTTTREGSTGRLGGYGAQDKLDVDWLAQFVADAAPDVVINLIAQTSVTLAETAERAKAHASNAQAASQVARACEAVGAPFVFVSTDYVFDLPWKRQADGTPFTVTTECAQMPHVRERYGGAGGLHPFSWRERGGPWNVDEPVCPSTWYARTKVAGEVETIKRGGAVLRVSFADPDEVVNYAWLNGFTLSSREWVERTAARIATWLDLGHGNPSGPTWRPLWHLVQHDRSVTLAGMAHDRFGAVADVVERLDLRADFVAGYPLPFDVRLRAGPFVVKLEGE